MKIKRFEFNYFPVNTYLLYDETGEAVLIDCGCIFPDEEQQLKSFIKENNLTLTHLLCTHMHLDHILGNSFINKTYGLIPEIHPDDVNGLPPLEAQAKLFKLKLNTPSAPANKYLTEGGVIRFGNSTLSVIHIPGHSPGSVVFYNARNGMAISGDVIFYGSIGRTDLWGGNQEELIDGIKTKLLTLPDETIIYPGHGSETTVGYERDNNPYL